MPRITAGQSVVNVLTREGVTHVFGMPGGHILGILDAISTTDGITSVLVRHEHTAAAMAAAHAQLTGEPGVVLVTAGPGVTNTATAVAEAFVGALPMVILSGRGATATVNRGASQELPTHQVFGPITKWSTRVDRPELLADTVRQAFAIARNGKPGPVLIDIPRDLLVEDVEELVHPPVGRPQRVLADREVITRASKALDTARRPLIIAGGGVLASEAAAEVRQLAEMLAAPVLTSLSGRGSLPEDHPLAGGGLGAHKSTVSKRLIQEADVVIGLGTRFEEMETNWQPGALPSVNATYIQVDIDPAELGRSIPAQVAVVGDVRAVVGQLLECLNPDATLLNERRTVQVPRLAAEVKELRASIAEMATSDSTPLHPVRVIRAAREVFPRETILAVDVGALAQHIAGAFPFFDVYEPRSTIVPSSFYGMGFVSAALPVARIVHPDRPALCFVGDGSFQMSMTVLPVAADHGLAVTWCVLNDEALGSIRDIQHYLFQDRIVDTDFNFQPDFVLLAESCGAHAERVEDPNELVGAFERALKANRDGRPAVIDARVEPLRLMQTREHYFSTFPQEELA